MRRLSLIIFIMLAATLHAQDSGKQMKALQKQREQLQRELTASQEELRRTTEAITSHRYNAEAIDEEMDEQLEFIGEAEVRLRQLDLQINELQMEQATTAKRLEQRKEKYAKALQMARTYKMQSNSSTLYILSGRTLSQMSRRARNTNFFATVLRTMGEELVSKQAQLMRTGNQLLEARKEMNELLAEVMKRRQSLGLEQASTLQRIASLDQQQRGLESQLGQQRTQLANLNRHINEVLTAERNAEKERTERALKRNSTNAATGKTLTAEEKTINAAIEQNKGRLPVPLTGSYTIGEKFGTTGQSSNASSSTARSSNASSSTGQSSYVSGSAAQFTNEGTNFIGKPGTKARSVYDGEVMSVFPYYNTKGVIVRHGSYISVYSNLSTVFVSKGARVHARDLIGSVAANTSGQAILHFQLRKDATTLDPQTWLSR